MQVYFDYIFKAGTSPVELVVKNLPTNTGDMRRGFDTWVRKIPWRRARQPTPVFLPGESHGQRILVAYSPWGCTESDMTEVTEHTRVFAVELWQQIETHGRKQDGCGKGVIWERVWFLEAGPCCPFLLFFLFLWFYDCILVVARQHWLHLLEADVPINLDFRDWKLRRVHYAVWKKQMKISPATFKLWISPELGSWRWISFYNWNYLRIIV